MSKQLTFAEFDAIVKSNVAKLLKESYLFVTDTDADTLWNLYLDSFPAGTNEVFRERREYDCSCCKGYVRQFGNVCAIIDNKLVSIWDVEVGDDTFQVVANAVSAYVKNQPVKDIFIHYQNHIGNQKTLEQLESDVITWNHYSVSLPDKFVAKKDNIPVSLANVRDTKNVLQRSCQDITVESVQIVLELIASKTLYRGQEWQENLKSFLKIRKNFDKAVDKDLFLWETATTVGPVIGRIKNHSIGTLLIDISKDVDLDTAVSAYERIVAPENYKRPKAIFTKSMIKEAEKTVKELGYLSALPRRHANIDDITANNVLFVDRDIVTVQDADNVFGMLEPTVQRSPKKFDKLVEVPIDKFIEDVLPTVTSMDVFVENKYRNNFVAVTTAQDPTAKSMFKWDNSFGWVYENGLADSAITQNVQKAGGQTDGVFRFSLQWNDLGEHNRNDFDAHIIEPDDNTIFFGKKISAKTLGNLDIDIITPLYNEPAVENIVYTDPSRLLRGTYKCRVHCYKDRGGKDGFTAEIVIAGEVHTFEYRKNVQDNAYVDIADVTFDGQSFTIKPLIKSTQTSQTIWGVNTQDFVPVKLLMTSPNTWDNNVGHTHYMFMLDGCRTDDIQRGFFNEFLDNNLNKHRKVFEALGAKMNVDPTDEQLAGLGFTESCGKSVVVRVSGATQRMMKVTF